MREPKQSKLLSEIGTDLLGGFVGKLRRDVRRYTTLIRDILAGLVELQRLLIMV